MRKLFSALSGVVLLATLAVAPSNARAGCGLTWRCGPYGCGWRNACWAPRHALGRDYNPWGFGEFRQRLSFRPKYRRQRHRSYRPLPIPYPAVDGYDFY